MRVATLLLLVAGALAYTPADPQTPEILIAQADRIVTGRVVDPCTRAPRGFKLELDQVLKGKREAGTVLQVVSFGPPNSMRRKGERVLVYLRASKTSGAGENACSVSSLSDFDEMHAGSGAMFVERVRRLVKLQETGEGWVEALAGESSLRLLAADRIALAGLYETVEGDLAKRIAKQREQQAEALAAAVLAMRADTLELRVSRLRALSALSGTLRGNPERRDRAAALARKETESDAANVRALGLRLLAELRDDSFADVARRMLGEPMARTRESALHALRDAASMRDALRQNDAVLKAMGACLDERTLRAAAVEALGAVVNGEPERAAGPALDEAVERWREWLRDRR